MKRHRGVRDSAFAEVTAEASSPNGRSIFADTDLSPTAAVILVCKNDLWNPSEIMRRHFLIIVGIVFLATWVVGAAP